MQPLNERPFLIFPIMRLSSFRPVIIHDPLQLSQQPLYQQPCPVKAGLVRELCQLVQVVSHSRQAAQQCVLLRCMPCRNGGRQCCLPDIDRQTPAGLPCPEPESLVADGGELHRHASGQFTRPAQCRTATFFLHPIHIVCHMFFLFRPYFFHSKICDRREWIYPPCNRRALGSKGFRESGNIPLLPPQKNPPAFSTLKRVHRGLCIHRVYSTPGNRLSDFSPLLDVLTVGGKMLPGKVLQQSGNAHATPAEPADDGVQFVPHILTDEHRLAVPDLRDGEVRFPVLLQRGPALPAARSSSHGVFRFRRGVLSSRLPGYLLRNEPGWNHRFRHGSIRTGGFPRTGFHHESFPPLVVAKSRTTAVLSVCGFGCRRFLPFRFFSRFTFHCTWILDG